MPRSTRNRIEELSPIEGLDVSDPADFLFPRYSPDLQNMTVIRGLLSQRQGGDVIGAPMEENGGSDPERIMGIEQLQTPSGSYVVRVGVTSVELLEQGGPTWTDIANTALNGVETNLVSFAYPAIGGVTHLVFTNFSDPIRKFDGSGNDADLGGSPPLAKFMVSFGGYLVLAYIDDGVDVFSQRAQWCDTGDPENWSTGESGVADLLDDDEPITGIHLYGQGIAVHKNTSIYYGYLVPSDNVFEFSRKETGSGTAANNSIRNLPNGQQIYLGQDGFHLFNGLTSPLIPSPINDELRQSMNPTYIHMATSRIVRELDEYWCGVAIGDSTVPDTIYKYNWVTGRLYRDRYPGATALSLFRKTTQESWDSDTNSWDSDQTQWDSVASVGQHARVLVGYEDGTVIERTTAPNDGENPIESYWQTRDFTARDFKRGLSLGTMIRWQEFHLWAVGNSVDLDYSTDGGQTWQMCIVANNTNYFALTSQFPNNGAAQIGYFDVESERVRFRLKNYRADESWAMKQFMIWGIPKAERQ